MLVDPGIGTFVCFRVGTGVGFITGDFDRRLGFLEGNRTGDDGKRPELKTEGGDLGTKIGSTVGLLL